MTTLTLPYPISANRYWRPVNLGKHISIVPTKEAKDYKADVAWRAKAAGINAPLTGRVELHIRLYPNRPLDYKGRQRKHGSAWDDTVQCIDLGNCEKVLSDALNGIAWVDDKQHRRIVLERMEPDEHGARVLLTIKPIAVEQPQVDLLETAA
jgi:crossover junction endodeoxyribonuclease RusA